MHPAEHMLRKPATQAPSRGLGGEGCGPTGWGHWVPCGLTAAKSEPGNLRAMQGCGVGRGGERGGEGEQCLHWLPKGLVS